MNRQMITATNTLSQLQQKMDIISHNMANVDTSGYKRRDVKFSDLMYQQFNNQLNNNQEVGRRTPYGIRQGTGARVSQAQLNLSQGNIISTNRPLDIAFTKENQFLKVLVQDENGSDVQFSRDGAFYLSNVNGQETMLVNSDGRPILDENNQQIVIPGKVNDYIVSPNGQFTAKLESGQKVSYNLGVISVNKPQFLEQKGQNLFGLPQNMNGLGVSANDIYTEMTGANRAAISMRQGVLEQSNVDMGKEMTELINVQRAYQFQARSITMADQMMGLVNGIR
ncbi:flagellar hook-basal body protein [Falsibacillus pallidus]|uniref:flagellar hook-basal body protein n=1 Tax=Falsibacillus pallidus TaxID=493781 RepID=UPI003D987BCA